MIVKMKGPNSVLCFTKVILYIEDPNLKKKKKTRNEFYG